MRKARFKDEEIKLGLPDFAFIAGLGGLVIFGALSFGPITRLVLTWMATGVRIFA